MPQNRERCFIIGHLRGRSSAEVFPIKGTDGENSVSLNLFGCLNGRNSQRDRVYSDDGLAPTISTKPGGNTEPKVSIKIIGEINSSQDGKILSTDGIANCHSAGHGNNPKIAIPVLTPDRAEKRQNGRRFKEDGEPMFTLTSQDRHGVATSLNPLGGLYTGVSKEFYRGIYEGCFRCLKANTHDSGATLKLNVLNINSNKGIFVQVSEELTVYAAWYEKYQCYIAIRKLTPKECFRLQGWSDDYFEKAQFVNSDSQLYKQAGNGVTVTVIEAIARQMKV